MTQSKINKEIQELVKEHGNILMEEHLDRYDDMKVRDSIYLQDFVGYITNRAEFNRVLEMVKQVLKHNVPYRIPVKYEDSYQTWLKDPVKQEEYKKQQEAFKKFIAASGQQVPDAIAETIIKGNV